MLILEVALLKKVKNQQTTQKEKNNQILATLHG